MHAGPAGITRGDDIEFAIVVHIPKLNAVYTITRGEVCFGSKGAIAIAQEYAGGVVTLICGNDVESAVAVHIPKRNAVRTTPRGEGGFRSKRRQGGNGWQAYEVYTKGSGTSNPGNIYCVSIP